MVDRSSELDDAIMGIRWYPPRSVHNRPESQYRITDPTAALDLLESDHMGSMSVL